MEKTEPKRTLRINITQTKDPCALRVSMRYGNHWWRATIHDERPWDAVSLVAITSKPAIFLEYFSRAVMAGEAFEKAGLFRPWVKMHGKENDNGSR